MTAESIPYIVVEELLPVLGVLLSFPHSSLFPALTGYSFKVVHWMLMGVNVQYKAEETRTNYGLLIVVILKEMIPYLGENRN